MAVPTRTPKRAQTNLPNAKAKAEKEKVPKKYAEPLEIPSTKSMKIITVVSFIIQSIASVLAIYGLVTEKTIPAFSSAGYTTGLLFLIFPAITWGVTIIFRLLCKSLPLEKWGVPERVKQAIAHYEGKPLKYTTLFIELVIAGCILYVNIVYVEFINGPPMVYMMFVFIALLALAIFLPLWLAVRKMDEEDQQ